jgi:hypothetical protein
LAEASSKVLLNEGMKIIYKFLDGEDVSKDTQSVLYKSLLFRVNFRRYFWSVVFLLVLISGFILVKML